MNDINIDFDHLQCKDLIAEVHWKDFRVLVLASVYDDFFLQSTWVLR